MLARRGAAKAMQPMNDPGAAGALTCGDAGGVNGAGEPCSSRVLLESGLCAHHDPDRRHEMKLVRAAGGRAKADIYRLQKRINETTAPENLPAFKPDTLERLAAWHQWASRAVAVGEIDGRTGDSICRHLKELRPVLIATGMEARVKELEAALKKAKRELGQR
jgi:hypothetical protein